MKRREFLTGFLLGTGFTATNGYLWQKAFDNRSQPSDSALADVGVVPSGVDEHDRIEPDLVHLEPQQDTEGLPQVVSAADKVRYFELEFPDDIYLANAERPLLESVRLRMERAQKVVGYGNYNLLSFDDLLKVGRNFSTVGEFPQLELDFMEKLFSTNAKEYGFLGDKVVSALTASFKSHETVKIPHSGHFLYKESSIAHYEKLKKKVGPTIILTSGIRSNVKQMHLFLAKTSHSGYNLSKASRSLAPPGHSYHGIGDYDVGKVGFGVNNFTEKFAETDEFKRMQDLGYIQIRYTRDNSLGVRYEPWHIKVV